MRTVSKCVIFGAAGFDGLLMPIEDGDLIIAADGGVRHLEKLGIAPHVTLGDFDSLGYAPTGAEIFPVEKDDTDTMLAVRRGLNQGCREFLIYGGLDGNRLDHTVANFQTLAFLREHGARGYLVGKDYLVTVLCDETAAFSADAAGVVSIFCLGSPASVTIRSLQYELEDGALTADFPLGVSNHFIEKDSQISVRSGKILVLWDRKNGLPTIL